MRPSSRTLLLALKPGTWANPTARVGFTVRDGKGNVKRSGRARLQAAKTVAFGGRLTAKLGRGCKVTVAGRIAKAGAAPLLAVTAEALRGGKVVKKATVLKRAAKAGAFSVPVVVKGMPKGAKVPWAIRRGETAAGRRGGHGAGHQGAGGSIARSLNQLREGSHGTHPHADSRRRDGA